MYNNKTERLQRDLNTNDYSPTPIFAFCFLLFPSSALFSFKIRAPIENKKEREKRGRKKREQQSSEFSGRENVGSDFLYIFGSITEMHLPFSSPPITILHTYTYVHCTYIQLQFYIHIYIIHTYNLCTYITDRKTCVCVCALMGQFWP